MGRHLFLAAATAALGLGAFFAAPASAAPLCPVNQSFFGTIQRVNGNVLTVRTPSGHWADVRIESGARINANGNTMRPGLFVGAFGCVTPGGVFNANELTLSQTQSGYNERLSGVIQRVGSGRLIVAQTGRGTGTWYVGDTAAFHAGQTVTGVGMIGRRGVFYPQTVNGRSVAFDTTATQPARRTITLSGTVQRVGSNDIIVWEPSARRSGTWIVPNAQRFRVGQRVSARGTEDRSGRFYVQEISIL